MESNRKLWNDQQKVLRKALRGDQPFDQAVDLLLRQHAMLHHGMQTDASLYCFEDDLWAGLTEQAFRCIPPGQEHSIAWAVWHVTRIEDVTMNLLLAGQEQLLTGEGWHARLQASAADTGNAMSADEIARLSAEIDMQALRDYRLAVSLNTRRVMQGLQPADLKRRVEPVRLQHCLDTGAVLPAARSMLDYWGSLTIAGLLLMPPTRHNFIHLNEALRIKKRCLKAITTPD